MKNPTKAQQVILERMAAGEKISTGYYGRRFMGMETVMPKTFAALLRDGWIEPIGEPTSNIRRGTGDRDHVITDAGRAALEPQP